MFWSRKPKCPITDEDREYVEGWFDAFVKDCGEEHFNSIYTITPTKNCYNIKFTGIEKDAIDVVEITKHLMFINETDIKVEFYSDSPIESSEGSLLSSPAEGIDGKWTSTAGTYQQNENEIIISFELSQLRNPISLIATTAHELSHYILLGEENVTDDEVLTDLTAIFYGFGIFIGNTRFEFSQYSGASTSGWQSRATGYLPEPVIAYATAYLSHKRKENTDYKKFFNKTMLSYFNKSIRYLDSLSAE